MSALLNFERFVQGLVEGSALRLLRSQIEPVEIARRLEYSLESNRKVGIGHVLTPSRFEVGLHPADYEAMTPIVDEIQTELAVFLAQRVKEQGWTMAQAPSVQISPDPQVKAKDIVVTPTAEQAAERTRAFPAATENANGSVKGPSLVRIDPAGAGCRRRHHAHRRPA